MADGGVPPGFVQAAYPGAGNYVDVQTVYWNYQAIFGDGVQDTDIGDEILEFSTFLDRREEMADLIHLTHSLFIMETGDSQLANNPQQSICTATVHSNSTGEDTPLDTQQVNFQAAGVTEDFIDTTESADAVGKLLTVGTYGAYEDASNQAGGSGGGQAIDQDEIYGWQLADPSFEERDELSVGMEYESSGDISNVVTLAGRATFGVYELEKPEVRSC
jgi:hypothetical protein